MAISSRLSPCSFFLLILGTFNVLHLQFAGVCSMPSSTLQYSKSRSSQDQNLGSLPMALKSWLKADRMKDKMEADQQKSRSDLKNRYDFIIAGAGTAGSIVAARLAQKDYSILLLEAGGQPHVTHENSAMSMLMTKHAENDWMYQSVQQNETCILCPENKYIFSAGKGLGGSANLNYLDTLYEGSFQDYSEWMAWTKEPGWGYYMLQPYFKSVKQYMKKRYPVSGGESPSHRSTFKALVRPSSNFEIQKFAHAIRVLFDDNGRAAGIEYEKHGSLHEAFASKEIIVSAGVFGSPKILMLSGIGQKNSLSAHNITVRSDLPVGKGWQDHLAIPLGPFFKSKTPESSSSFKFLDHKSGTIADSWNSSTVLRMPLINLNYHLYSREMSRFMGINEGAFRKYMDTSLNKFQKLTGSESMFINVALKKPVSRGEVSIAGKDPNLSPLINPNYLNAIYHQDSLAYSSEKQTLIEALEDTVRLMENNPSFKSKFTEVPFPGCESYIFRGYGYWDCYIRHFSMSFNHGVGTCAMGSSQVPSVVNPELKVHGVPGLRVIDASVIPTIPGTYPFLSVAVVAEKGVEMVIKEHESLKTSDSIRVKVETSTSISSTVSDSNPSSSYVSDNSKVNFNISNPFSSLEHTFSGFRIKKLSSSLQSATTPKPIAEGGANDPTFTLRKAWQKMIQIVKSISHTAGSSLSEDDLIPPGEPPTEKPNPSYFAVKPFGAVIFHPLIPQSTTTTTTTTTEIPLLNSFQFKL